MKTHATLTSVLMIFISCATAPAAFVAVEFGGRVTGGDLGHRSGTRVSGYFIYEPGVSPYSQLQTASPPSLVVEMTDTTYFERSEYGFHLYNNWLRESDWVQLDGFALSFYYPGGYGWLSLMSSNTSLFTNGLTPTTIPAVEQFDAGSYMVLTVDQTQPYRTTAVQIDRVSVVPVVPGHPVIFGVGRRAGGLSFRFLAEASRSYTVQVADNLAAINWATLTNIGPAMEHVVLINDLTLRSERSGNRFYRVRRD